MHRADGALVRTMDLQLVVHKESIQLHIPAPMSRSEEETERSSGLQAKEISGPRTQPNTMSGVSGTDSPILFSVTSDNLVGRGGAGSVYRAHLDSGSSATLIPHREESDSTDFVIKFSPVGSNVDFLAARELT